MKKWQYWIVTALGILLLIVILMNISLFRHNRLLQGEINSRQTYINQSIQLEQLNREIITALANLSMKNNDEDLKQILAMHGITFSITANTPAGSTEQYQHSGKARR